MTGRLKDLMFGKDGKQILMIELNADFRTAYDELKNEELEISIKKQHPKRSLDANAYCWALCNAIAQRLSDEKQTHTKEDIYRASIREVGIYKDFEWTPEDAKTLRHAWEMLGTGWITEQVDFSQDGERLIIRCYYGSSRYNSKQRARLIDNLIQDCHELGIPTDTPEKIAEIKSLWAQAPAEKE